RRRLASGALALAVLQLAVLFAAPVSVCCLRAAAGHRAAVTSASADEVECCPPGSHAPGECPLHRNAKSRQTAANAAAARRTASPCRMMCDAPHGPQFLIGTIGLAPAPQSVAIQLTSFGLHAS